MQFATTVNGKKKATPRATGWCPGCSGDLVTKCGEINIWHWAHRPDASCDWDTGKMSEWHIEWQEYFDENKREVKVETNGKRRMADVITQDGTVLEFQHSSISAETIKDREAHYKKMLWVFDASDLPDDRFIPRGRYAEWKHPRKSWLTTEVEAFYDLGTGWLWLVNEIIQWDYVRIYGYSVNKTDFIHWARTGEKKWTAPTWAKYTHEERQAYETEKRRIERERLQKEEVAARAERKARVEDAVWVTREKNLQRLNRNQHINHNQHIGRTYPTEFGGMARIIVHRQQSPRFKTTSGLWWNEKNGVLITP